MKLPAARLHAQPPCHAMHNRPLSYLLCPSPRHCRAISERQQRVPRIPAATSLGSPYDFVGFPQTFFSGTGMGVRVCTAHSNLPEIASTAEGGGPGQGRACPALCPVPWPCPGLPISHACAACVTALHGTHARLAASGRHAVVACLPSLPCLPCLPCR